MTVSERLRMLDEQMMPGPWFATVNDLIGGVVVSNVDKPASAIDMRSRDRIVADMFIRDEDARAYVALRNALPALVALVEYAQVVADVETVYPGDQAVLRSRLADLSTALPDVEVEAS